MSVPRACLHCRSAKKKCDLARPTCGRCTQLHLLCIGQSDTPGLVFLDESEVARRNSERARQGRRSFEQFGHVPSFVASLTRAKDVAPRSIIESSEEARSFLWLDYLASRSDVQGSLARSLEGRAVDRFFVDWVLHPGNDGLSPGEMHFLPSLYANTPPSSSLRSIVRALAFAQIEPARGGETFQIKARQEYGTALVRLRQIVQRDEDVQKDSTLATLLLVDCFESLYLARDQPLGPHRDALKYILHARGDEQFNERPHFCLWRIAHQRLQGQQILSREEPSPAQMDWLAKLNLARPDVRISADVLQVCTLCARANRFLECYGVGSSYTERTSTELNALVHEIETLLSAISQWTSSMSSVWNPQEVDLQSCMDFTDDPLSPKLPAHETLASTMLLFSNIWIAAMWNFHIASCLVLRETLLDLMIWRAEIGKEQATSHNMERLELEKDKVKESSSRIIRTLPALLGYKRDFPSELLQRPHGKMLGRYFLLFPTWIIQQAKYVPDEHKQISNNISEWIEQHYKSSF